MEELIRSKLSPDENVLWEGRPELGIFAMGRRLDLFCIGLFIIYAIIVIMLYMFDKMIPLNILVFIPLYLGIFFWLSINFFKMRTRYVITDKRILSLTNLHIWQRESHALINKIQRVEKSVFPGARVGRVFGDEFHFDDIKDVDGAYNSILSLVNRKNSN